MPQGHSAPGRQDARSTLAHLTDFLLGVDETLRAYPGLVLRAFDKPSVIRRLREAPLRPEQKRRIVVWLTLIEIGERDARGMTPPSFEEIRALPPWARRHATKLLRRAAQSVWDALQYLEDCGWRKYARAAGSLPPPRPFRLPPWQGKRGGIRARTLLTGTLVGDDAAKEVLAREAA